MSIQTHKNFKASLDRWITCSPDEFYEDEDEDEEEL
jgi:hypothetical protein